MRRTESVAVLRWLGDVHNNKYARARRYGRALLVY